MIWLAHTRRLVVSTSCSDWSARLASGGDSAGVVVCMLDVRSRIGGLRPDLGHHVVLALDNKLYSILSQSTQVYKMLG